ncbi:MAG TPA: glycine cleavage T C-terminal barrel domain-containing protein [Polyangiales bacterium]
MQAQPSPRSDSEQALALRAGAGLQVRADLRVVRVEGEDRQSWLNGQITGDLRNLTAQGSVYALAINVRGKILADVWVLADRERLLLLVPASAAHALLESLERYVIMEDVVLTAEPDTTVISVQGPRANALVRLVTAAQARAFACDELGEGGVFVLAQADQAPALLQALLEHGAALGALPITEDGYELARLRAGRPRFGRDFDDGAYPQEAGLKHALSFNKGCYLGQEVVCTLETRGRLTRKLCLLKSEPGAVVAVGAALLAADGQACGQITSCVRDPQDGCLLALGYVKRAHATAGELLHAESATLRVVRSIGDTD